MRGPNHKGILTRRLVGYHVCSNRQTRNAVHMCSVSQEVRDLAKIIADWSASAPINAPMPSMRDYFK